MSELVDRGCTCHLGHPPCGYCTDTAVCSRCQDRFEIDDFAILGDDDTTAICLGCADPDPDDPDYLQGDCDNCGRTRILPDGSCEKCNWNLISKEFDVKESSLDATNKPLLDLLDKQESPF